MTCIVGIIEKNKVYIGGDSAGVPGYDITVRKDTKVFKIDNFVFGCTSSFRMIQLIMFSFKPPKRLGDEDIFKYICTSFINELRLVLSKGGYTKINNNEETGGIFLVGYCGRLFKIEEDFQVSESVDYYNACGCGESYAKGALFMMDSKMKVKDKIIKALETATYFSVGVRPPFIIESV
jgi:ATP-dependent protease HslVU (ClpYQ) peptidase subunit